MKVSPHKIRNKEFIQFIKQHAGIKHPVKALTKKPLSLYCLGNCKCFQLNTQYKQLLSTGKLQVTSKYLINAASADVAFDKSISAVKGQEIKGQKKICFC